jgi:hypothetical protein
MSQLDIGATKGGLPDRAKRYGIDQQAIDNKAFDEPQKRSKLSTANRIDWQKSAYTLCQPPELVGVTA